MTHPTQTLIVSGATSPVREGWIPPTLPAPNRAARPLALLGLLILLLGVPVALVMTIGWPLPTSLAALGDAQTMLFQPLRWAVVVNALAVVAWLAWAQFSFCAIAELIAAGRGRRAGQHRQAPRVPFGGFSQALARRLVEAAFATATLTAAVGASGFAGTILTPARPAVVSQQPVYVNDVSLASARSTVAGPAPATQPATPAVEHTAHPEYVVQPPHGGYYDSLWAVAERFLGDGQRWREVYELNQGREQSDGRSLNRPELIRPGWRLLLPRNAIGLDPVSLARQAPGPSTSQPPSEGTSAAPAVVPVPPSGGGGSPRLTAPSPSPRAKAGHPTALVPQANADAPAITGDPAMPGPTALERQENAPAATGPDASDGSANDQGDERRLATEAVGGVLAAAALAAIAMLRHRQRRRRPAGRSIELPNVAIGRAEGKLRILSEPADMTFVDETLRALTVALSGTDGLLPDVQLAFLHEDHVDFGLAERRPDAPAPFVAIDDGLVWRAAAEARPLVDSDQARWMLPLLPLLVTIGRDAGGPVLLDLEAVGSLAIEGAQPDVLGLLAHVAAESVLAPWTAGVEVLLVGFDADLAADLRTLEPDRVTAVEEIDSALLRALATRVSRVAAAGDRLSTRVEASRADALDEARPPLLVVFAAPPAPVVAEALTALVPATGRGAVAVIAPAPWSDARATWLLGGPLPISWPAPVPSPCRLEPDRLGSLAETFRIARRAAPQPNPDGDNTDESSGPQPQPSVEQSGCEVRPTVSPITKALVHADAQPDGPEPAGDVDASPADELDAAVAAYLSGTAPAAISLLGPVTVEASGNVDPDRRARLTEIAAYLATHRRGAPVDEFDAAIWPARPVTLQTRNQAITRARAWLGDDEDGVSWLRPMSGGTLRLSRHVLVDWDIFKSLQQRAGERGRSAVLVRRDLETALRLLRGRPLSQPPAGRYAWLAETYLEQEIPSAVIDVAHRLAQMLLADGAADDALDVARRALEVDRYDERPWRDLLQAHELRGEVQQIRALVDQLCELLEVELDDELQPETALLIERLLPRRRRA